MPKIDFFIRLGILGMRDFLDESFRAQLIAEAKSGATTRATTIDRDAGYRRQADWAYMSEPAYADLESRFRAVKPALENHFSLTLTGFEELQHLIYNPGDFYRPHTDNNQKPDSPDFAKNRKISIVIFLNQQCATESINSYEGGSLTLYGLMPNLEWASYGFSLEAEAGLLVAFRSHIRHEVTPVISGRRHTIVSWFF
jgi:predicted 2-oxoglutarate/Fe(II)-dependent dioxygenase YbiX